MDPMTIMMLGSLAYSAYNASQSKGEQGSEYNEAQQGGFDDIFKMIEGMRGGSDITQNGNYQQGSQWLNSLFNDPEFFKNFEAPLQRQFEEQTVPDLANRFASMGSGGALGSTGFRNQLAREGSNLGTNIAALRGGMQQQGVNQSLQYGQQPFNNLAQLYQIGLGGGGVNNLYQPPNNPGAPIAGAAVQGYFQNQGMQNNQKQPGQSPLTY
jgi:hypothetical protein